jgi:hypothetical protein
MIRILREGDVPRPDPLNQEGRGRQPENGASKAYIPEYGLLQLARRCHLFLRKWTQGTGNFTMAVYLLQSSGKGLVESALVCFWSDLAR